MIKTMYKKPLSMLVITLFVISFAVVSVSQSQAAQANIIIKGTIVSIEPDVGKAEVKKVTVKNEAGRTLILTSGTQTDLTAFKKGNRVLIRCNEDWVIQSIVKQD